MKIEQANKLINKHEKEDLPELRSQLETKASELDSKINTLELEKANLNDLNSKVWSMANMGQDVKEAMTGGSVAVVDKNTILKENIVNGQVTRSKTNFYNISTIGNLIDRDNIIIGEYVDNTGHTIKSGNSTEFILIDINKNYKYNFMTYVTYWNESEEFIQGYIDGNASIAVPQTLINKPQNAKYVKFSIWDSSLSNCVFAESSYFSNGLQTKYYDKNLIINKNNFENFKVLNDDIEFNTIDRNKTNYYIVSLEGNLIDVNKAVNGKYINNSGSWVTSSSHLETDYIEIDVAKDYKHNVFSFITYWSEDEEFLSGYIEGNASTTTPQLLKNKPQNAKYVRLSGEISKKTTFVLSLVDTFDNNLKIKYEDESLVIKEYNLENKLLKKINTSGSLLAGKTINIGIDSITYGVDGSTNGETVEKPYPSIIAEITGATVYNRGIPGSTIAGDGSTQGDYNVLGYQPYNIRYNSLPNADYEIVFGGINDYTANVKTPLGEKGDTTNLTFYGALKILIEGLIKKNPNGRIGFVTPLRKQGDTTPNVYGYTLKDYRDAIIEMCNEYSIPVLDLYTLGGCYPNILEWRTINMTDGLHPTQVFYYKIAKQIAWFINSI